MKLTVKPIQQKDAQKGLAAIDRESAEELGVEPGDFVLVEAGRSTVAKIWPGYKQDTGNKIIRIDNELRREADANVDQIVNVEKADVSEADEIKFALPDEVQVRGDLGNRLRQRLAGRAVMKGQYIHFSPGMGLFQAFSGATSRKIPIHISETSPGGAVKITENTQFTRINRSVDQTSGGTSRPEDRGSVPVSYEDIGGLDEELDKVREMIELPMRHPELFQQLGVEAPKGVLLHGPPGTGKTLLARAISNETDANFETISGPEIMSKYYGESEEQLREVFERAEKDSPSIIFIDEIDSIAPKRGEATGDVERRVVAQLLSLMDGLEERGKVMVIGATNRVDAVDPALRRAGRFDREIEISVPDKQGRKEILQVHTRNMPIEDDVDLEEYAENTHGFVGADIEELAKEAAMNSLRRIRPEIDLDSETIDADLLDSMQVKDDDFRQALHGIEPSALREVFVEVPEVTWDDIGGLDDTKERLQETVQWPIKYPAAFNQMDMQAPKGVLLYGPPGTGKTMMAKAVANESNSNFISIKGPELLSKWVGESEKGVREMFQKARENAPTVIFFDEIDAIAVERGSRDNSSGVGERVVSQLLTELDGLEELEDVIVIATTNRPDLIDSALLRPGRLDRHVHIPAPDLEARRRIFEVHTRDKPVSDAVDLDRLARRSEGYVGADIEAVCREASMAATRDFIRNAETEEEVDEEIGTVEITMEHFERALANTTPSITDEMKERYEEIEQKFESGASGFDADAGRSFR